MLKRKSSENTQVCKFEGEVMPRFYIKMSDDCSKNTQDDNGFFHIYYKRTHSIITKYIQIGNNINERVRAVKELLSYSVEDFYTMLLNEGVLLNDRASCMGKSATYVEKDVWYRDAWIHQTDKFLKKHHLTMVNEGLPVEFIDNLLNDRARKRRYQEDLLEMNAKLT